MRHIQKKYFDSVHQYQSLSTKTLASITGGNDQEDKIIYIDGKPYRIKTNSDGTTELIPLVVWFQLNLFFDQTKYRMLYIFHTRTIFSIKQIKNYSHTLNF